MISAHVSRSRIDAVSPPSENRLAALLASVLPWLMLILLACAGGPAHAQTLPQPVLTLRDAQVLVSDAPALPPDDAGWRAVTLPERSPKPRDAELVGYWYKAAFTPASRSQPLWLYLPRLPSGGAVFVNGALIGDIPTADALQHVRWYRPFLLMLPSAVLRDGPNNIAIRLAIREPLTSFGEMQIGPEAPLREAFDWLFFWERTAAELSTGICLFVGVLILLFWLRRPQERLYGLFGLCVLSWGLRTLLLRLTSVPIELNMLWRCTYYSATGGFIVLISIFMVRFSGGGCERMEKIMIGYLSAGVLLYAAIGVPARQFMNSWWLLGFLPFTLCSVYRLCRFALAQLTWASLAMGVAVVFALSLSLHDFAVQEGWWNLPEIYLMHLAIPSFLLVMAGVLSDRFLDSLRRVETINEDLALRVAEREREIAASYERVRLLERVNAATEERQRIMQDMHDGVGSQLLTTLVMVERGGASREVTLSMLQDCMDDMRLAIESLSPDAPDLLPVLGNFRFRMEARFKAMGLRLRWHNVNMPDALELAPHAGLNVLRMLQEALANVLKHARATSVEVELIFSSTVLQVNVTDDGVGFANQIHSIGYGLKNMLARANRIGASFKVEHLPRGTAIRFVIPLPDHIRYTTIPATAAVAASLQTHGAVLTADQPRAA
jgi:signal transduction histidine kinase